MEPEQVQNIMDSMIKKLYDMELEELGRSGWQDEKLLSEVRKLLEKNKASIQVEDKTGREGVDLAFAIAEIGEEIGFTQGFKCAFQLFWNAEGNRFKWYKILKRRLCVGNTHSLLKSLYKFD